MLDETAAPLKENSPTSSEISYEAPHEHNLRHSVVDWLQYEEEHFTVNNPLAQNYLVDSPIREDRDDI